VPSLLSYEAQSELTPDRQRSVDQRNHDAAEQDQHRVSRDPGEMAESCIPEAQAPHSLGARDKSRVVHHGALPGHVNHRTSPGGFHRWLRSPREPNQAARRPPHKSKLGTAYGPQHTRVKNGALPGYLTHTHLA